MKIGDLVRSLVSLTEEGESCVLTGILVGFWADGVLVLWDHGEVCFSPDNELEVISGSG